MYQIFVVEDELLIRQSIRGMVENMSGPYVFCGEASDGEMALSIMQDLMPDIMITDIKMPFLDGFELIHHAKAIMPWLKTIIISGYDEFESAQKAISLGVDMYLLKPVRMAQLTDAVQKVAAQLEQSRSGDGVPAGYNQHEMQHVLYQHFMQQLFFGEIGTSKLLERATSLGIEMIHPFYQVVMFHFESDGNWDKKWQKKIVEILRDRRSTLYYFNLPDYLTLLLYGKNKDSLNDTVYRLINIIRHELKDDDVFVTTLVGGVVERLSLIKDAYDATNAMLKKVQAVSVGQVIDINDTAQIATDIVSFSSSFGERYGKKLLYASAGDIPILLDEFLNGTDSNQFQSMLYRYYTLVDILKTAIQIISAVRPDIDKKDIASQFSSAYDIFTASGSRETFQQEAKALLLEAIRMKRENLGFVKYSHVISRAEGYIRENYCDPNISLISVSKHVGMSPAHFSTIFSQTLGKTFISYLTSMRIERAKELLAQTDMKLSAIAMEIGYNEPNYFSHVFKRNEGVTPKEYRNSFAGGSV